ncbi:MAG: hypothetical protein E7256_08060 [Lachnospiraceae bacterium]|nr:hypothetical protein [Lachnospiraceae bacterium]
MSKEDRISKQKISKGEHGYIDRRKRQQLLRTIIMFSIAAAIYITGLALNKWENTNVFTIVAALWVLPSAKFLVNYIVLAPFKTVGEEQYEKVLPLVREGDTMYTDMVFTSTEKVMDLAFLIIRGNEAVGLIGREKEDASYMEQYLKDALKKRAFAVRVTIEKKEDVFLRHIKRDATESLPEGELKRLQEFLQSLMV